MARGSGGEKVSREIDAAVCSVLVMAPGSTNSRNLLAAARQQRRAAVMRHNSLLNLQAVLNHLVPLW